MRCRASVGPPGHGRSLSGLVAGQLPSTERAKAVFSPGCGDEARQTSVRRGTVEDMFTTPEPDSPTPTPTPIPGPGPGPVAGPTAVPAAATADRLLARSPEDLVAFVPLAIGFVPQRSAVLLSLGGPGSFHARVDLPHDPGDVDLVVDALLRPAERHLTRSVAFVLYDDDTAVADETAWSLHHGFVDAGIEVVEVLRVHQGHWFAMLPGRPSTCYDGVPFDVAAHPFSVRAVVDGRVTLGSREELRATLDPRPRAVELTAALLADAEPAPTGGLRGLVERHLAARTMFTPAELASVAVTITSGPRRDEVWAWQDRAHARQAVELWSDAVRRLPRSHAAAPAAVLAFAAWLAGEGALAWCAVDASRAAQPDHSLAGLVAGLLESATSPDAWVLLRGEELTDPAA